MLTGFCVLPLPQFFKMNDKLLRRFMRIALLEGISSVLLFCVTMPLKYLMDWKALSYWTGMAHGILFIAYILILIQCWITYKWAMRRVVIFGIASLVPFATFWVERKLKREQQAKTASIS
jgi:integral membrane protein